MGYLTCENCGGYYHLKDGESSEDFDKCECGGTLKKSENLENKDNLNKINTGNIYNSVINRKSVSNFSKSTFCPNCGSQNRNEAEFCKNCGYTLKDNNQNLIHRLNGKINILAVFIGLVISLIVLVLSPLFVGLVTSGTLNIIEFAYLILLPMVFIGGFIASILGSRTYSEGLANGGLLSIISLVNLGFVISVLMVAAAAIVSAISSAFSSFGGSSYPSTTSNSYLSNTTSNPLPILELILLPFLIILFGMAGGWFGVFIKKLIK